MKVMMLGTAAAEAYPGLFCQCEYCDRARKKGGRNLRARHSILVDDTLQIDFGSDMVLNLFRYGLDFSKVQTLLISHGHMDHLAPGELSLRGLVYAHIKNPAALKVYGNAHVEELLGLALDEAQGRLEFQRIEAGISFMAGEYEILPLTAAHDPTQECLLFVVTKDNKSILYGTDSGEYPPKFWEQIKGCHLDLALMDCTCGRDAAPYDSHMGFPQNIKMRERLLSIGVADESTRFVSTHYSHNGHADYDDMLELSQGTGFEIAYDGMIIDI